MAEKCHDHRMQQRRLQLIPLHKAQMRRQVALSRPRIVAPFPLTSRLTKANVHESPSNHTLRKYCPLAFDQGPVGSCTANAICHAYKIAIATATEPRKEDPIEPSRLYLYYKERMADTPVTDSGADAEDGLRWLCDSGVCTEAEWPYVIRNTNSCPPMECDKSAACHRISGYFDVDPADLRAALLANHAVVFCCFVYRSFMSVTVGGTGIVPMPTAVHPQDPNDPIDPCEGAHCMVIVGYDDRAETFLVLNSWGTQWGQRGFCTMPYDYITSSRFAWEFRAISGLGSPQPQPNSAPFPNNSNHSALGLGLPTGAIETKPPTTADVLPAFEHPPTEPQPRFAVATAQVPSAFEPTPTEPQPRLAVATPEYLTRQPRPGSIRVKSSPS